jgi:hypothetical protein
LQQDLALAWSQPAVPEQSHLLQSSQPAQSPPQAQLQAPPQTAAHSSPQQQSDFAAVLDGAKAKAVATRPHRTSVRTKKRFMEKLLCVKNQIHPARRRTRAPRMQKHKRTNIAWVATPARSKGAPARMNQFSQTQRDACRSQADLNFSGGVLGSK